MPTVRATDSKGRHFYRESNRSVAFTHCLVINFKNGLTATQWTRFHKLAKENAERRLRQDRVATVEICEATPFTSREAGREYAKIVEAIARGEEYVHPKPEPKIKAVT